MEKYFLKARELAEFFFCKEKDKRKWGFKPSLETECYIGCYEEMMWNRWVTDENRLTPLTKKNAYQRPGASSYYCVKTYGYPFENMTYKQAKEICINKLITDIEKQITFPTFYSCEYHDEDNWNPQFTHFRVKYTPDNQLNLFN